MNLENLNLVELNAQEVQEVEGGCWYCTPLPYLWNGVKAGLGVLAGLGDGLRAGLE